MPTIPKLRLNNRANENVKVANLQAIGNSEAAAIQAGTKAIQAGLETAATITDLKIQQEAKVSSRQYEMELQKSSLNDKDMKLKYEKDNGGLTGFAEFKAARLEEQRNALADKIGHTKVREQFLNSTNSSLRKGLVFDYQKENNFIKQQQQLEKDMMLSNDIFKVQNLSPDLNGEREFDTIVAKSFKEIDQDVENGLVGEQEATILKNELNDTLGYNRVKDLVQKDNLSGALNSFRRLKFSSPKMQERVGDMIRREELSRLKNKQDETALEIKELQQENILANLKFEKQARAIRDANIPEEEKTIHFRQLINSSANVAPATIKRYEKLDAGSVRNKILDMELASTDPDTTIEDLEVISQRIHDLTITNSDNQVTRDMLLKAHAKVSRRLETKTTRKERELKKAFLQTVDKDYDKDKIARFDDILEEYEELPIQQRYEMAQLEVNREFSRNGISKKAFPEITQIKYRNVNRLANEITDEKSKAELREKMFKDVKDGYSVFTFDSTIYADVDSLIKKAEDYKTATEKYNETRFKILKDADGRSRFATD